MTNAFLEGEQDYQNFMYSPKDLAEFMFGKNKNIRVEILKGLYGEKQSGKLFNDKLNQQL